MTVRCDGNRLAFVSKNSSRHQRHGSESDVAECINGVCSDITMALYVIIKKGIKRIGTNGQGLPDWASWCPGTLCVTPPPPTGVMVDIYKRIYLIEFIYWLVHVCVRVCMYVYVCACITWMKSRCLAGLCVAGYLNKKLWHDRYRVPEFLTQVQPLI